MKTFFFSFFILIFLNAFSQIELRYENNQTLEYAEVIKAYQYLDEKYEDTKLMEMGLTDSGRNLHLFLMKKGGISNVIPMAQQLENQAVILINNGIHPGEPCGIDASIAFAEDLLKSNELPENVVIGIIPVYNIGGALNRGRDSRANQNGPEEHGFRGNARHLDLNRDFIKADALNTKSFYAIFHFLKPHIFIDTHTSNGADYQYTMTFISTQKDKLNPILSKFLTSELEPFLYENMKNEDWEMTSYVNVFRDTPDKGFAAFLETPRYASGFTTLFNTIGFITETHMFKPYKDRVESTREFLHQITNFSGKNSQEIIERKKRADDADFRTKFFTLNWTLDSVQFETREFKGFEYDYLKSEILGQNRLKYNREKPKTYEVKYFADYKTADSTQLPQYYILPQAYREVAERLQYNGVQTIPLQNDTTIRVESTYIFEPKFRNYPYEGHFVLTEFETEKVMQNRQFLKGDYLIPTENIHRRFLANTLEPAAADSYLRWNFFDEIFQQKEYFSPYVFEETAQQLLDENPELKIKFENWKKDNPQEAEKMYPPLEFIYKNSDYYEPEHLRYPVAKIW